MRKLTLYSGGVIVIQEQPQRLVDEKSPIASSNVFIHYHFSFFLSLSSFAPFVSIDFKLIVLYSKYLLKFERN